MTHISKDIDHALDDITDYALKGIEFQPFDIYGSVSFWYQGKGLDVQGDGVVEGVWCESGDGIETPIEYYVCHGKCEIFELTVERRDEDTEETGPSLDDDVVEKLRQYLNSKITEYLRSGFYVRGW